MPETLAARVRAKYPGAYDDLSDTQLEAAVTAKYPGVYDDIPKTTTQPPMATPGVGIGPDTRGAMQRGLESFSQIGPVPGAIVGGLKRADNMVRGTGDLMRAGWNLVAPDSMDMDRPYLKQGPAPPVTPNEELGDKLAQVGEIYGGLKGGSQLVSAIPGMARRALGISSARAGERLSSVAAAAKDVPVSGTTVEPTLVRAGELVATGSRRPKAVMQLMKRLEGGGDLSFQEAQDFASSMSRLSANEYNSLNPQMQRQVTVIRNALRDALTSAAETVGKGAEYQKGISEYARAAKAAERWEAIKPTLGVALKRGLEGAGLATGGTLAYKALNQ